VTISDGEFAYVRALCQIVEVNLHELVHRPFDKGSAGSIGRGLGQPPARASFVAYGPPCAHGEGVATIEAITRDLLLGTLYGDLLPDPFDGFDPFGIAISGL
jgi:hypothetical protein